MRPACHAGHAAAGMYGWAPSADQRVLRRVRRSDLKRSNSGICAICIHMAWHTIQRAMRARCSGPGTIRADTRAFMHIPYFPCTGLDVRLSNPPDPARLPPIPTFHPTGGHSSGLEQCRATTEGADRAARSSRVPAYGQPLYNPAAALPPKMVKRVLVLEFVEMSEL